MRRAWLYMTWYTWQRNVTYWNRHVIPGKYTLQLYLTMRRVWLYMTWYIWQKNVLYWNRHFVPGKYTLRLTLMSYVYIHMYVDEPSCMGIGTCIGIYIYLEIGIYIYIEIKRCDSRWWAHQHTYVYMYTYICWWAIIHRYRHMYTYLCI